MKRDRKEWAQRILKKADPHFRHPWLTYDQRVRNWLTSESVWIDGGSGDNLLVRTHRHLAKRAIGVDMISPPGSPGDFVQANLYQLPFVPECADLVTLCFVVEHLADLKRALSEISRVLKRKGRVLILTSNSLSPQIFLPRLLLPFAARQKILARYWPTRKVRIFPTEHRFIGPAELGAAGKPLRLDGLDFFSDINYQRRWIFILQLLWHLLTRPKILEKLRTTVLISLEKDPPEEG